MKAARKKTALKSTAVQRLDEWSPSLLKSRLYGLLLVDIIIGQLAPGERLDEQDLTRRYGGGLAGVREALARLALEGLVQRRARVGTIVAPLDLVAARDAFEARALIEVECARLAAANASAGEITAIRATLDGGEAAVKKNDARALAAMDEAFHVAVASASGNRTLAKMVTILHHQTARFWLYAMRAPQPEDGLQALAEHAGLAEAIAAHDPARAQALMREVLGTFPTEVKRTLETR
ncbi:MAG TPA: GntR family transcriptional regulator [Rhizomicrobium sp.]|nr:GntR family transcriptional regulator [Rhizomicrobium sp.]